MNVGAEKEEVGGVFDENVAEGLLVHIGDLLNFRPRLLLYSGIVLGIS